MATVKKAKAKTKTRRWDAVDSLKSAKDVAAYLDSALEEGSVDLVAAALGDIARSRGMAKVAKEAGVGRESLYKALAKGGNPELATFLNVVRALGLRLEATAR